MHHAEVRSQYTAVVDLDRKYIEVSDSFCRCTRKQLIGHQVDEVTAPNSTIFRLYTIALCESDIATVCGSWFTEQGPAFWFATMLP
jgi:hypothetical protein